MIPAALSRALRRRTGGAAAAREFRDSVLLEGRVGDWATYVELGFLAARHGYKGVLNDLEVLTPEGRRLGAEELRPAYEAPRRDLEGLSFDVAVVGGGVVGCAVARELTRWAISVVLLEKEHDVAVHTSGRNDGVVHDGFAARPGSLKAAYNVRGNRLWEPLARELGIEFSRPGSLVLFSSPLAAAAYPLMADRARRNGVDGWEFWSRRRVAAEEPSLVPGQFGAFRLPSTGMLSPYKATVALAESAARNGARIALGACLLGLDKEGDRITRLRTSRGDCRAAVVVNAAGNWADKVAAMADDRFFSLHQRRGTDMILDRSAGAFLRHIMAMPPLLQARARTKGGGLVTTVEGNVLVGPTAAEAPGREDYATRPEEIEELGRHLRLNRRLSATQVITYFSGVRPCAWEEDFVVERSARVPNLVHAAGIQSPGLASAPAIAEDVARMAVEALGGLRAVSPNPRFEPRLEPRRPARDLALEDRAALVARAPAYGRIVCRCEEVSEGELRAACRGPLGATSLDALKRRTRAGAGRCHGGFCTPRAMEILAEELGVRPAEVTKKGPGSPVVAGPTKAGGGAPSGSAARAPAGGGGPAVPEAAGAAAAARAAEGGAR